MCRTSVKCSCQVDIESTSFMTNNNNNNNTCICKCITNQQESEQQEQPQNTPTRRKAHIGDIVTIDFSLQPENGYIPHSLFDTSGEVTFVLGWGNYLPGLHALLLEQGGMAEGDSVAVDDDNNNDDNSDIISIDAGWGQRRQDLIVTVLKSKLQSVTDFSTITVGCHLNLEGDIQVLVTDVTDTTITVDANPPLAGSSYRCQSLTLKKISSLPAASVLHGYDENQETHPASVIASSTCINNNNINNEHNNNINNNHYQVATFGLGCFWGAQLAFSRTPGVVGTKAGYTQGTAAPTTTTTTTTITYDQLSSSRHVEAVCVVYDASIISYAQLLNVAMGRLEQQQTSFESWNQHDLAWLFGDDDDDDVQYRHGFYFHTAAQEQEATDFVAGLNNFRYRIELLPATTFHHAEEYHQHYLLKGGQSARKGAKESIRCFG